MSKDEEDARVDESLYKQLVGILMYLIATRPDMYFVCLISRYMSKPIELYFQLAKRIMR